MSTKTTELTRWTPGPHYFGDRFDDYYVILSKSRDSDAAERSNFDATVKLLGENGKVIRAAHFLVGWMEQILVHEKNKDGIRTAEDILRKLKDYPVLDEDPAIILTPKMAQSQLKRAQVWLNKDNSIHRLLMEDYFGALTELTFTSLQFDTLKTSENERMKLLKLDLAPGTETLRQ